jgi:thiol-disulfide isomerase/thioredoxin
VRRLVASATVALLASALTGCGGSSFSAGEQGFVSGDGTVTVLDEDQRAAPDGEVAGRTVDGRQVSLDDYRGQVVVMPVWGSWCGPCRAEAPMLADAARDLEKHGVVFLGIDSRDPNTSNVKRFLERFDIPYDSIHDPDGVSLLAFHGTLPPMTIPSFVFIDAQGRIAARALDELTRSTLYGVVEDVLGKPVDPAPSEPTEPTEPTESAEPTS